MFRRIAVLVLCLAAPVLADEFRDAKKAFEDAFSGKASAEERLQAVVAVGFYDTRDAAKLIVSAIGDTEDRVAPMRRRQAELTDEIEKIIGDQLTSEQRTLPQDQSDKLRNLKQEAAKLQEDMDGENRILTTIEETLSRMRGEETIDWLGRSALQREKHWKARQIVALALTSIGTPEAGDWLEKALRDRDDRVRLTAAIGVGILKVPKALDGLLDLLKDDAWTVRSAAIQALGEIGQKGAVGPLIDQIEKEDGRLREDCAQALSKLTGQRFGQVPSAWRKWWEEHKGEYGEAGKPLGGHPPDKTGDPGSGYYGIPITTNRAIFILDVSGSMSKSTTNAAADPGAGEMSKIDMAKKELTRVLTGFDPKGAFNVVVFNDAVKRWKDGLVPATKANKEDAKSFVGALSAGSSTNIYDALELAFRMTGMGATDKNYDLAADTIFLLSDGSPTTPDGQMDDWMKIIRAVREWNRLKRIKVHAIGVGGHNAAFMSMLASENGGEYVSR